MSKKIVKNGIEYEYEETVTQEDMTIKRFVPDRSSDIDDETIEKYQNSPQWKELDDLYIQLLKGEGNSKEILQKIVSYGEIAIVKHNKDAFKFMKEGSIISSEFLNIPFYFEMPPDHVNDFLERTFSDDKETSIIAQIELNEFIQDYQVEKIIDIVGNARKEGDNDVANGAMGELMRIGEISLPQLQLKISEGIDPQFQLDLTVVALTIIFADENKAIELINRSRSEVEKDSTEAILEINKLINDIDLEPYFKRHPKLLEKMDTFQNIIQEVFNGLSGNSEDDIKYLSKQAEIYKNHEMGKEIVREIGRAIANLLPENVMEEYGKIVTKDYEEMDKSFEEANFQIYKKNYDKALAILEEMIEKDIFFEDDDFSQYNYFSNIFELVLYSELNKPKKTVRQMTYDWSDIYFTQGNLLFELERYSEAEIALNKSIRINPVKTKSLFQLSEIYKIRGELDKYFDITNKCLKYSYKNEDLARCYRNLGYYYVEKEDYDLASAVLQLSLMIDSSYHMAMSELQYISQVTDKKINELEIEEMKNIFKNNNIQFGPNHELLEIAAGLGRQAEEDKDFETAILCFRIFHDLTGNEEAKMKIDKLQRN